ncbi:hypothetical protein A5745_00260 [Mycobacterium sp. IS-2888]|uniref:hemophore-related protein n=1 Tax=unclassified Mycobacterium TaxID=2642494 RepID=UPI0009701373|nr:MULTISPECIES: hemophore-related protein [unclassified Mycobacterium]OMC46820.1 hypothetical protein A5744_08195 [Mycobacterium sp. IS-1264]OMC51481.1 hypothetical protein A5745_00260 [Mycobacterium sp. IS-2888]
MIKLFLTGLGIAVGSLALSLTAGVASADPDLGSAVNTTCNYQQVAAALNAQDPQYVSMLNSSPQMQAGLRRFLAAAPAERQRLAQLTVSNPDNQPLIPILKTAFDTCNNF